MPLGDLLGVLRDAYCRTIGIEYMHIQDTEEQRWIQSKVEGVHVTIRQGRQAPHPRAAQRRRGVREVPRHQVRRHQALRPGGRRVGDPDPRRGHSAAADAGLDSCVIGMAHRGRLNVLSNIIGKSYDPIFSEFEGHVDPTSVQGSGDVKYHLGATGKYVSPSRRRHPARAGRQPEPPRDGRPGRRRDGPGAQDQIDPPGSYPVLPILIHGDAAFAGQGVVAETLAMSDITGYRVGGTIHLIINNQIGFTTSPEFARSSLYCSDVAKTMQAPIFHVNGDDPEACVRVARWRSSTASGSTRTSSSTCRATAATGTTRATTRATPSR